MTRPIHFHIIAPALCALLCLLCSDALAQTPTLTQTVQLPDTIHPGTPVTLTLEVIHPLGTTVQGPEAPESIRWKILQSVPT